MKLKKSLVSLFAAVSVLFSVSGGCFAVGETDEFFSDIFTSYYIDSSGSVHTDYNTNGYGLADYFKRLTWSYQSLAYIMLNIYDTVYNDIRVDTALIRNYAYSINNKLDSTNTYLDGVEGYIDGVEGYIDGIESKIDTTNTQLGYLTSPNSGWLFTINDKLWYIKDYLNTSNGKLDTVNSNLSSGNGKLDTVNSNLSTIIGYIDSVEPYLNDIKTYVSGFVSSFTSLVNSNSTSASEAGYIHSILQALVSSDSNNPGWFYLINQGINNANTNLGTLISSNSTVASESAYIHSILQHLVNNDPSDPGWLYTINNRLSLIYYRLGANHTSRTDLVVGNPYSVGDYLDRIFNLNTSIDNNLSTLTNNDPDNPGWLYTLNDKLWYIKDYSSTELSIFQHLVNNDPSDPGWLYTLNNKLATLVSNSSSVHSNSTVSAGNNYTVPQYLSSLNNHLYSINGDLIYYGDSPSHVFTVADLLYMIYENQGTVDMTDTNNKLDEIIDLLEDMTGEEEVDNTNRDSVINWYNDIDLGGLGLGDLALDLPTFDIAIIIPDVNADSLDFPFGDIASYTAGYFAVSANTGGW